MSSIGTGASIKVGAAPVSWGVFDYSEDEPLLLPPEVMLDQMQAAGYAGTELGGPRTPLGDAAAIRRRLADRELSLVGAFLPQRFSRAEHAAEDHASMLAILDLMSAGRPDDVMPKAILSDAPIEPGRMGLAGRVPDHPEAALPPERFALLVDNIQRAAEACRERGYDPVLHFHAGTYVETDEEIHAVFDALDLSLVGMCLDTGHALYGGADPLELLNEYGDAVRHVHVKDCDLDLLAEVCQAADGLEEATDRGVFCDLGEGTRELDPFLEALRTRGWEGWLVVEQDRILKPADTPAALLELHTRNREWLTARGF